MPTAIEYAVAPHWHAQNGCGGGPPAAQTLVPHTVPLTHDLLLAAPPALPLLVVAVVTAVRRRARSRH